MRFNFLGSPPIAGCQGAGGAWGALAFNGAGGTEPSSRTTNGFDKPMAVTTKYRFNDVERNCVKARLIHANSDQEESHNGHGIDMI